MLIASHRADSSFPVECSNDDSQVAWELIDGRKVCIMRTCDVRFVRGSASDMKALDANTSFEETVDELKQLFNEHTPHLEQLRIQTVIGSQGDDFVHVSRPPTYMLRAANLPRLHKLVAIDTSFNLDWPLCGNLRHLHLAFGYERDASFRLPLSRFLHILRSCPRLEILYVDRYIDASTPAGVPPPPVLSLAGHSHLREASFRDDSPHTLSKILSCLIIPARVTTRISTYVVDRSASYLRAMIPDDLVKLPILGRATEVRVSYFDDDDCCMQAKMLGEGPGHLELELYPSESFRMPNTNDSDGALLYAMFQSLDIFNGCPAQKLHVIGHLQYFTLETWITAFDRFPGMEQLEVEDEQAWSNNALEHLLLGLASRPTTARPGPPLCPRLQRFRFQGAIHHPLELKRIHTCFVHRATRLRLPPLRLLELDLYPNAEWSAEFVRRTEQMLAPLAATVVLKVNQPEYKKYGWM